MSKATASAWGVGRRASGLERKGGTGIEIALLALLAISLAVGHAAATDAPKVAAIEVSAKAAWWLTLSRGTLPRGGCFTAAYPSLRWTPIPCVKAPARPYAVGAGVDYVADAVSSVFEAEGSFQAVSPAIPTESQNGVANTYSLQLNTNGFQSPLCATAADPAACYGLEQFIYSNTGNLFIQYWLKNYGSGCPSGWTPLSPDCYEDSVAAPVVPVQPPGNFANLRLLGNPGIGGVDDEAVLFTGSNAVMAPGLGNVLGMAMGPTQGWHVAEFNVFGDGYPNQANFGPGTLLTVRVSLDAGTRATPNCVYDSLTAETNNLYLASTPVVQTAETWPAIVFDEGSAATAMPNCATASSNGDTHLTTFGGLLYDFQASGDFVLATTGPDFEVQTRQVSGAPAWPGAAVNTAVAMRLDSTRVALYAGPTQLYVDGGPKSLADGQTLTLPGGGRVSRAGDAWLFVDRAGDSVRAEVETTCALGWLHVGATCEVSWINVAVGLGQGPASRAVGLLGAPAANPGAIARRDGAVLAAPVSFQDLYGAFTKSWRVSPEGSLFPVPGGALTGVPSKPFFATDLDPAKGAQARSACAAAGVKGDALLDACALDAAVLGGPKAITVFVRAVRPKAVVRPVVALLP